MSFAMIVGGLIGYLNAGFAGLLMGAALGYGIGVVLQRALLRAGLGQIQSQFLDSTFAVMGAMCKADGQVTADEIRVAEALFDRLHLSGEAREKAKAAFNQGKEADFDLDAEVAKFKAASRGAKPLLQMFLQVQISAMAADGKLHPAEQELLRRVARGLGLSEAEIRQLEAMLRTGGSAPGESPQDKLDAAYEVLGVSKTASDAEIKKAYRRLMSQNHPDKLAGKGMPESMREMAERKTSEISNAYDIVQQARA